VLNPDLIWLGNKIRDMADNKTAFVPAMGYNWLTYFYDMAVKLTMPEKKFREKLIDELDPKDNETILEFGFGTAQNIILANLRNNKAKLRGVDIDPKIRDIAFKKIKELGLDILLDLYDGKVFPYADNSFNKVFSSLVFHHLNRETKILCLKEIYRTLKPNGQLIIGDWGQAKSKRMRFVFYGVQLLDGFETTNDNVKGLLPKFIEMAGFKNVVETAFINTSLGTYSYYKAIK
jgi:ubiquinone/menaquinone biosynthesis C-methylase UbiE